MGSAEKKVFPSHGHRSDAIFHQIVIDAEAAIPDIDGKPVPAFEVIGNGLSDSAFGQYPGIRIPVNKLSWKSPRRQPLSPGKRFPHLLWVVGKLPL